ncbi:MAG: hypothetical protein ACRDQZ_11915, partial [Mycobacteriales bacterium]
GHPTPRIRRKLFRLTARLDPAGVAGQDKCAPPTGAKNEGDGTNPEQRITDAVSSRAGGKSTTERKEHP